MFSSIIGHKKIKGDIYNRIKTYPSGTFLFHGPASVGKRTIAFEAAKLILCEKFEEGCLCDSCKHFYKDHPDLLFFDGKGKIKVADIDRLIDFCYTSPFLSNNKVIIIDNAENITWGSSNRLLKILEEPPNNFSFFLITASIQYIIPTIISRCIKYEFECLMFDETVEIIQKLGFDKKQAQILGWLASDSSLDVFYKAGQIIQYRDMIVDLLADIKKKDLIDVLDFVDKIEKGDLPLFADIMTLILTDLLLIKDNIGLLINMDVYVKLGKIAEQFNKKALLMPINLFSQAKKNVFLNTNMNAVIKNIFIKSHDLFLLQP